MPLKSIEDKMIELSNSLLESDYLEHRINSELEKITAESKYAPLGSFDELNLGSYGECAVFLVNTESRSLYGETYIAGNPYNQALINLLPDPVVLTIYEEVEDGGKAHLVRLQDVTLEQGQPVFLGRGKKTFELARPQPGFILSLRDSVISDYNNMYDRETLAGSHLTCLNAALTQLQSIMTTMTHLRQRIDGAVAERLERHPDSSIRWLLLKHYLQTTHSRAIPYLNEMVQTDRELGGSARLLLKQLNAMRENR